MVFVGLDVHKTSINVALLVGGEPVQEWQLSNDARSLKKLVKRVHAAAPGSETLSCYEAGPCGYVVHRELTRLGLPCAIVAPSMIPVKPGEHIKTDRRDARKLATMLRSGMLTAIRPPDEAQEAVRDLCRCREAARKDLLRSRHRLTKMLLRRGLTYEGKSPWTKSHREWLFSLELEHPADQATLDDYLIGVQQLEQRITMLNERLQLVAQQPPYQQPVAWLRCFRGIDTVTALAVVAELHDFRRFPGPRQLMAFLGLVPSEYSSGGNQQRGSITKAGNGHVRRLLVEAAWHYRHVPRVNGVIAGRRAGQPTAIVALAQRAESRLNRRFRRLVERGKPANKALIAIARELVGFIWRALASQAAGAIA